MNDPLYQLNEEMHNIRNNFLNNLEKIVHPKYVEQFGQILHYAWQESLPVAEKISEELNIYPIDFVAFSKNANEFRDLLIKEKEMFYA